MGFRVDREQALVLGGRYLRALIAGAAAAAHELGESRTGVEPRLAQPTPLALGRPHGRLGTVAGAAVYGGFVAAIVCLALVVLNVDLLLPAAWTRFYRLVCGAILLLGSVPLVASRLQARQLLIARLTRLGLQPSRPRMRVRGWRQRLLDPILQLAGVAMLAAAVFELARAIPRFI